MPPLLRCLVDITLLRKGPGELPPTPAVVVMCLMLWLGSLLGSLVVLPRFDERDAGISLHIALIGWLLYWALLLGCRQGARVRQTLAALMGCGAVISVAMLATQVLLTPLLGPGLAALLTLLVLVWSVPVKGHIIARALGWHWYAGIVFAMIVFVLQYTLTQSFSS